MSLPYERRRSVVTGKMGEGTLILQNYRPMSVSTQVNEKETPEKTAPPQKNQTV